MNIFSLVLVTIGLCIFEIVSSVDNAIVNASVLEKMNHHTRKLFLIFGVLFAVIIIRGILPWLIVFLVHPSSGIWGSFMSTLQGDPSSYQAIEQAAPRLFLGGGIFLLLLFLYWLCVEEKEILFFHEKYLQQRKKLFFIVSIGILSVIVVVSSFMDLALAIAAIVGAVTYFVVHQVRTIAEKNEGAKSGRSSELSKLLYLILIDATFSIDGVLGAFAFTLSVPLILLGNGAGAIIMSWLTVKNVSTLKKYLYLKNGALYSIGFLSLVMVAEGFGLRFPEWVSPVITLLIVGYSFYKSHKLLFVSST